MLTRFDNGKFIGHRWSDDSKTITFSHSDGRRDKLFKTGIVPGTTQPLNAESKALLRQPSQAIIDDLLSSSDGQDFAQSQWLVNGEYLYQLTNLHQGWHLLKRQLDGLHEVQRWRIPENIKPQSMFDLDEDGKVLFISILEEISSDLYVYQL